MSRTLAAVARGFLAVRPARRDLYVGWYTAVCGVRDELESAGLLRLADHDRFLESCGVVTR